MGAGSGGRDDRRLKAESSESHPEVLGQARSLIPARCSMD